MIRLFSATLLSLLLCASLANAAEKPLIVASDATWPPIVDETRTWSGIPLTT
ncbi:MAG: hypothetical protein ACLSHC_17865 [Bilophila wadsworthia]